MCVATARKSVQPAVQIFDAGSENRLLMIIPIPKATRGYVQRQRKTKRSKIACSRISRSCSHFLEQAT